MDPLTIAGLVVAALVRYAGEKGAYVARRAGHDVDSHVDDTIDRLYDAVKARITGQTHGQRALRDLEADPTDSRRQGRLEAVIEALVVDDPTFGTQLQALLDAAGAQPTQRVDIQNAGAVAIEGNIHLHGTNVAGRDLTIDKDSR